MSESRQNEPILRYRCSPYVRYPLLFIGALMMFGRFVQSVYIYERVILLYAINIQEQLQNIPVVI